MANVQYTVLYRYLHPVSNKPVTNKQKGYKNFAALSDSSTGGVTLTFGGGSDFKTPDLPAGQSLDSYLSSRNYTTDKVFDQLFVFKAVKKVVPGLDAPYHTYDIHADSFVQVNGDPWFVASVTGSLESAMATATRLVKKIGISNVKLVKNVPIELEIGIE